MISTHMHHAAVQHEKCIAAQDATYRHQRDATIHDIRNLHEEIHDAHINKAWGACFGILSGFLSMFAAGFAKNDGFGRGLTAAGKTVEGIANYQRTYVEGSLTHLNGVVDEVKHARDNTEQDKNELDQLRSKIEDMIKQAIAESHRAETTAFTQSGG